MLLTAVLLIAMFSPEIADTDFWWHLKTGQYLWETHRLPDPDPFAFTTATAVNLYSGESATRHFNLTHEWLSQLLLFLVYRTGGFPAVVLVRAAMLALFCAIAGWIAYRRTGGFYRALAVAVVTAVVVQPFAADRPYLVTFVLLALTIAILESGTTVLVWILPVLMLIWANSHGGFVLGWFVLGAWSVQLLWHSWRGRPDAHRRSVWLACLLSMALACLNPSGLHVIPVLWNYHHSFLTSTLAEWRPPLQWPPSVYSVLLAAAAVVLAWSYRRVRVLDWLLFVAFAAAGLMAGRNIFLIGFLAPILIASYLRLPKYIGKYAEIAAGIAIIAALGTFLARGRSFQLHAAEWSFPAGPAGFLQSHRITGRLFNTYEYGGYLIWRLWPQQQVFIDGRALSESVYRDYGQILYAAGPNAPELLDRYGIDVIVMNTFEYNSGVAYSLAPLLAEAEDAGWKLVYADGTGVVFMRQPDNTITVLEPSRVFDAMQQECQVHVDHDPGQPACARALGLMYASTGDPLSARRWLSTYLRSVDHKDPEAEAALEKLPNP